MTADNRSLPLVLARVWHDGTISLGTGLSCFVDHSICGSETICLVRECPLQTVSDRAIGHATGTMAPWTGGLILSMRTTGACDDRSVSAELASRESGRSFVTLSCKVLWILPPVRSKSYFSRVIRKTVLASFSNSFQESKLFSFQRAKRLL